ncbi:DUF3560 domain-containing protein [Cellulomonas marina]|uniref:DUF3560 domain-containing protein n=1 Tax=Cellulomonas marina TaxID=988821 RepID=A0A1I1ATV5_9CELL|nr:DUF3560 domain-containing protein [Cellulomonas marina]GIG29314.1 hypothetical protein Cma02nite_19140 [Cellulomonas marina]SFB39888.1 protein of unknown function [Cellulomonas marina]
MSALRIEHDELDGTLLHGTARDDGAADTVKALGWRWSGRLSAWFVPRSRARFADRGLIERTAGALREAGHEVDVDVDDTVHERAHLEARQAEHEQQRAERLQERAARHRTVAEQADEAGRALADRIPLGQPILLGHHSQRRAERDRERIERAMRTSIEHDAQARRAEDAARAAAGAAARRHAPVTVANRIQRLEAQIRKTERALDAAGVRTPAQEAWSLRVRAQLERDRADLAYWTTVRGEQIAAGIATDYGPTHVAAGDMVKVRGRWLAVVRANPKTVTVAGLFGNDTTPWHEVQDHHRFDPCKDCGRSVMDTLACPNVKTVCLDCCGEEDH